MAWKKKYSAYLRAMNALALELVTAWKVLRRVAKR
jgi:hypothetical protein